MNDKDFTRLAIDELNKLDITYGDVRVQTNHQNTIVAEDRRIEVSTLSSSNGFSIRVLKDGHWGFSATPIKDEREIEKLVRTAYNMAHNVSKVFGKGDVELVENEVHVGSFKTPYEIDPFNVSLEEKTKLLLEINEGLMKKDQIKRALSMLNFIKQEKLFASTEGSLIDIEYIMSDVFYKAIALADGEFKVRTYQVPPRSMGYENINRDDLKSQIERVADEAIQHLSAKPVSAGVKDLILDPGHLALVIHESVGHPTELDRVLGYEMSLAGDSFADLDKLNNYQYAAPIVNFLADNTLKHGLSSTGYDDEGVKCSKWYIVKDGILNGYGTNRETARYIDANSANGTCRADSWASVPIVRIPNLSLMPGKERLSLEDLIADTKDGIYIQGRGSWSIDQKRLNFQFGGDAFWEVKDGKITGMLKDVTYQSMTPEFWKSCDAICDERYWVPTGLTNCGKGDPSQLHRMTHGSSPSRFRNINIGSKK